MGVRGIASRTLSVCMHPHESEKLHCVSGSSRKPLSLSLYGQGECVGGALDELTLSCRPGQRHSHQTETLALVGVARRWVALRAVEDPLTKKVWLKVRFIGTYVCAGCRRMSRSPVGMLQVVHCRLCWHGMALGWL